MQPNGDISAATLQHYLKGANYPASKEDLIKLAEQNQAPQPVMQKVKQLPQPVSGRQKYDGPQDVEKAFGKLE